MATTTDLRNTFFNNSTQTTAVESAIAAFQRLSVDDRLGLLWVVYENMGGSITPAAPGAARLQLVEGLLQQFRTMSYDDQLQAMRDLVNQINTPVTRAYGVFTNNNKLAFWYQLAEMMRTGEVVPMPKGYKLSTTAANVFSQIRTLEFGQQLTVLRQSVAQMGYDPVW